MYKFSSKRERIIDILCAGFSAVIIMIGIGLIAMHFVTVNALENKIRPEVNPPVVVETEEPESDKNGTDMETPGTNGSTKVQRVQAVTDHKVDISTENSEVEEIDFAALAEAEGWTGEAQCMAQMLYGEDPHGTKEHQAAVYWCVLNRLESPLWPADTVYKVVTAANQFHGYSAYHPIDPEMYRLALDVIGRWLCEWKYGIEDVGRVLPKDYFYFHGDGLVNTFTTGDLGSGSVWDWSLPNPYRE